MGKTRAMPKPVVTGPTSTHGRVRTPPASSANWTNPPTTATPKPKVRKRGPLTRPASRPVSHEPKIIIVTTGTNSHPKSPGPRCRWSTMIAGAAEM